MMKHVWILVVCVLSATGAYAQAVDAGTSAVALQRKAEHERINAERALVQKNVATEEAACYQKFVVNSCLADIRAKRRTALADLKRQELLLNDAERKERAEAALQGVEDRKAAQAQKLQDVQNTPKAPAVAKVPRSAASAAADAARAQDAGARRQADNAQKQASMPARSQPRPPSRNSTRPNSKRPHNARKAAPTGPPKTRNRQVNRCPSPANNKQGSSDHSVVREPVQREPGMVGSSGTTAPGSRDCSFTITSDRLSPPPLARVLALSIRNSVASRGGNAASTAPSSFSWK